MSRGFETVCSNDEARQYFKDNLACTVIAFVGAYALFYPSMGEELK